MTEGAIQPAMGNDDLRVIAALLLAADVKFAHDVVPESQLRRRGEVQPGRWLGLPPIRASPGEACIDSS